MNEDGDIAALSPLSSLHFFGALALLCVGLVPMIVADGALGLAGGILVGASPVVAFHAGRLSAFRQINDMLGRGDR